MCECVWGKGGDEGEGNDFGIECMNVDRPSVVYSLNLLPNVKHENIEVRVFFCLFV